MIRNETYGLPPLSLTGLALAAAAVILVLHAALRFDGLQHPAAMEYAQLARRIATGQGYTTVCLRPYQLAHMQRNGITPDLEQVPATRIAPLYPAALAGILFLTGEHETTATPATRNFSPETQAIIPLALACLMIALLIVAVMGITTGRRIETNLAVVIIAASPAFRAMLCSAGAEVLTVAVLTGLWFSACSATGKPRGFSAALLTGLIAAACLLTSAATLPGIIAAMIFILWNRNPGTHSNRYLWIALPAFIIPLTIWGLFLQKNSGGLPGTALYSWVDGSMFYASGIIERSLDDIWRANRAITGILQKGLAGWPEQFARTPSIILWLTLMSAGLISRRQSAAEMRFSACVAGGILLSAFWNSATATEACGYNLAGWLPLAILAGVNAGWKLLENAQLLIPPFNEVIQAAILLMVLVSLYNGWRHSPRKYQYPPYYPAIQASVTGLLPPDSAVCTDIPWATAWYGATPSVLLPRSPADTIKLNQIITIGGVYLTGETQRRFLQGTGSTRWHSSWLPLWRGEMPSGWPWARAIQLPPGTYDQLLMLPE